ncbi:mannose-6-phosphate isomerase, class I [Aspergillus oryzae]|uniref:Mannose-6-phosphate isomerase n=1 Tax=Aspergillus oryzae TaxID=5062 RepID=A0A1S9DQB9_ASPOZ|nr:mannose-6-phosphate isomerase, class I [Aspergillus oryzae]
MQVPLLRLQCGVNSYDWGKIGQESAAARYAATTAAPDFSIESEKPYAELWMGTHPSLPSKDVETQRTLLDMVQDNQALLSKEVSEKYGGKLPFLFKVLSVNKALSIQAHPNKKLAEKLHARDPRNYPDDNHKPEMTIAITPFEGLCGFRPLAEISHFLNAVAPLRQLIGTDAVDQFLGAVKGSEDSEDPTVMQKNKDALRIVFTALMNSSSENIEAATKELTAAAQNSPETFGTSASTPETNPSNPAELAAVITRLNGQFPNDIGLFVFFFLNFVKLAPGEAMFLKADDIHAYVSGDIIECMASSDNVVRAGFTPKFKDVDTLTDMLTYSYAPIEEQKLEPKEYPYAILNASAYSSASSSMLYDPPIEEFSVVKTDLKRTGAKATFDALGGPSILICTGGTGKITVGHKTEEVKEGYVFFVGADAECIIENTGSGADEGNVFTTFKAFCDITGTALYNAITGIFRGQSGASGYGLHIGNAALRKLCNRLSAEQFQYMNGPTRSVYETALQKKGLQPETVPLKHGAQGHWIGNKNAKNVVIYYHGGGFAVPGAAGHMTFYGSVIDTLNAEGHDIALFLITYSLTPHAVYPTQLRQAVEALRYILTETNRDPANVIVGGDSAGGNLAVAVLLHLSHPHPEIEPLSDIAPLAGLFAFAPWVSFVHEGASMQENQYKDMIGPEILNRWSHMYLAGKESDAWSEPNRAPTEWWRDAKVKEVLILAGRDEILFDSINAFVKKFQSVVPNTKYLVGHGETHVAPVYGAGFIGKETQQGNGLKEWLQSRL